MLAAAHDLVARGLGSPTGRIQIGDLEGHVVDSRPGSLDKPLHEALRIAVGLEYFQAPPVGEAPLTAPIARGRTAFGGNAPERTGHEVGRGRDPRNPQRDVIKLDGHGAASYRKPRLAWLPPSRPAGC